MSYIQNDWDGLLATEFAKPYYIKLMQELKQAYHTELIYPSEDDLFLALNLTSYADTKAVILGQDPYHGTNQAHGLSFSVKPGVQIPPSLHNIYKELYSDMGCSLPEHGCLLSWAEQGVLLLNAVLSVRAGQANSHKKIGWQRFTNRIISLLNERDTPVVFILWGSDAAQKLELITNKQHHVIQSVHPSPLSSYRGFFGSKPFSRTNQFLIDQGKTPINWQI
ncbi:MAG: uracil-DNA glycosylase [Paenibacillaceae bacterium]